MRRAHYPRELNRIAAHLTLFHTLPDSEDVGETLMREAARDNFLLRVTGLRSLGRGVAYTLESGDAGGLHGRLARDFALHLTAQDKQGFRPHVVVQNKTSAAAAHRLLEELSASFTPWDVTAVGLSWWDYLGGPWELRQVFPFHVS